MNKDFDFNNLVASNLFERGVHYYFTALRSESVEMATRLKAVSAMFRDLADMVARETDNAAALAAAKRALSDMESEYADRDDGFRFMASVVCISTALAEIETDVA